METPSQSQPAQSLSLIARVIRTAAELDTVSKFALLCIFFGWFLVDTLLVTLGSLQHGVRFFDISSVIADPTRLFFGVQGFARRFIFSGVCALCLLAPLLPHLRRGRENWLGYLAPLVLIMICGVLLYSRTSSELFATPTDAGRAGSSLIRFANGLVHQGSGLVARHVSVGVGGYVALIASMVLALRGIRKFQAAAGNSLGRKA
ncbi:MAG TPA: hypothetical protein VK652_12905 [Steroidobacteraceae bacterium]|nr:hypothetical protein [Steroidobacteraceae bacterium]